MTSSSGYRATNRERKGFTLVELIVVVSIMMILAGAGLSSGSAFVKSMRFNSAFSSLVSLTQRARNRAVNETRAGDVEQYGVFFNKSQQNAKIVTLFGDKNGNKQADEDETIDALRLENAMNIDFVLQTDQLPCLSSATVLFGDAGESISLYCDGSNDANKKSKMRIGVRQNTDNREKTFSINNEAGIAQL